MPALQEYVAIERATLLDGTGADPIFPATVVIMGERIVAAGPSAQITTPNGATILDGRGAWLIPGLVDMHVHVNLCGEESLPLWLANGVTSVRDIGGDIRRLIPWREELATGQRIGPRLFTYGPMIDGAPSTFAGDPAGNFENLWSEVDGPEAGCAEVDRLLAAGVDGFKLYQNLPPETLRAMLRRIDGRVPATGHLCRTLASDAIRAGISCLEHNFLTAYNDVCRPVDRTPAGWTMTTPGFWAHVYAGWARIDLDAPQARAFVELLAASGVAYDPTASLGTNALGLDETEEESGARYLSPTLRARRQRNVGRAQARAAVAAPDPETMRLAGERQLELIARIQEAGGIVIAGTDTGAVQPLIPGFSLHRELRWLVRAGMTPKTAIERATRTAAETLRRADDQGTIRPGKRADLLMLDADPLADIRNARRIRRVIKDGAIYDPQALLAGCQAGFSAQAGAAHSAAV